MHALTTCPSKYHANHVFAITSIDGDPMAMRPGHPRFRCRGWGPPECVFPSASDSTNGLVHDEWTVIMHAMSPLADFVRACASWYLIQSDGSGIQDDPVHDGPLYDDPLCGSHVRRVESPVPARHVHPIPMSMAEGHHIARDIMQACVQRAKSRVREASRLPGATLESVMRMAGCSRETARRWGHRRDMRKPSRRKVFH
jgi:hypothetical protein